jgi:hypothetical protein
MIVLLFIYFAFYFVCSVFLYCFVYCFSLCTYLFLFCLCIVYRPLPPVENPIAVNKYHIIYHISWNVSFYWDFPLNFLVCPVWMAQSLINLKYESGPFNRLTYWIHVEDWRRRHKFFRTVGKRVPYSVTSHHFRITAVRSSSRIEPCCLNSSTLQSVMQFPCFVAGKHKCREEWPSKSSERAYNIFLDAMLLLVPLVIMTLAYSLIVSKLWKGLRREIRHNSSFRRQREYREY